MGKTARRKSTNLLTSGYRGWPLLSDEQQKAVKRLARALRGWPDGISLFGWSGSLVVTLDVDEDTKGQVVSAAGFLGVHCDGGDPHEYAGPLSIEDPDHA